VVSSPAGAISPDREAGPRPIDFSGRGPYTPLNRITHSGYIQQQQQQQQNAELQAPRPGPPSPRGYARFFGFWCLGLQGDLQSARRKFHNPFRRIKFIKEDVCCALGGLALPALFAFIVEFMQWPPFGVAESRPSSWPSTLYLHCCFRLRICSVGFVLRNLQNSLS
jgi:hypothetical protein